MVVAAAIPLLAPALAADDGATLEKIVDRTIDLPSGPVFYRDSGGDGVPVIFLHAGSGNSMLWEHQIPAITAAGYRFIAINYRGAGATRPVTRVEELVASLGLPRFHLIGTAAGGGVALEYALANRDRLRSLVVTNSIGNVRDPDYLALGRRLRPPEFDELPLEVRELGPSYRAADPEGVERWLALSESGRKAGSGSLPPSGPPPAATLPAGDPHAVTWERLAALRLPVLLMTGDADLYTPPSVLRQFAEYMPSAEMVVVTESGHSAYWENPASFNSAVLEFLTRH